jgi:hypothetical protein
MYYIIIKLLDYLLCRTIPAETGNGTPKYFVLTTIKKLSLTAWITWQNGLGLS